MEGKAVACLALLGAFFVTGTLASVCCTYDQFEANILTNSGNVFVDQETSFSYTNLTGHIANDVKNQRNYVTGSLLVLSPGAPPQRINLTSITVNGTQYTIVKGTCTKKPAQPLPSNCIPDAALRKASGTMGNKQVETVLYSYSPKPNVVYELLIEPTKCIPLTEAVYTFSTVQVAGGISTTVIGDLTEGIKDPSVFNPPSSCFHDSKGEHHDRVVRSAFRIFEANLLKVPMH